MPIKRSKYDVAINLICLLLLSGMTGYLFLNWSSIPDKIPGHYNAIGQVDRWGSKGELLALPIIGWAMFIGITVVEHFPKIWNTGVTVTEENRERVYRILKNMSETIKLVVVITFVYLTANSVFARDLPFWFLLVFLALLFGSMIFFLTKLKKAG
jgi:uncharacterized membrane protein